MRYKIFLSGTNKMIGTKIIALSESDALREMIRVARYYPNDELIIKDNETNKEVKIKGNNVPEPEYKLDWQ